MTQLGSPRMSWRQTLPWLCTLIIVGYMAWTTDFETLGKAFSSVDLPMLALLVGLGAVYAFVVDTYGMSLVVRDVVVPITYRDALPVKATSYFLNVLNYNVALVGMALYLKRKKGAPFWRSLGAMFLLNVVDLLAVCCMMGVGLVVLLVAGVDVNPVVQMVATAIVALFIPGFLLFLVVVRLDVNVPFLRRLVKSQLLLPFSQVTWKLLLHLLVARLVLLAGYLTVNYSIFQMFSVPVPLSLLLVYQPLITFIQVIPVSVSGLGAPQLVMRGLLAPLVPASLGSSEAVVDAATTAGIFGFMTYRLVIAYLFMGKFSKDVVKAARGSGGSLEDHP